MKKLTFILVFLLHPLVVFAIDYDGVSYTEVFYMCTGGNGTHPEDGTCANAYDPVAFYSGDYGYWGQTDSVDHKIGPNDALIIMSDGGDITKMVRVMYTGLLGKPITIRNKIGQEPVLNPSHLISSWTGPDANGVYSATIPAIYGAVIFEDTLPKKKATSAACSDGAFYSVDTDITLYYKPTSGVPSDHTVKYVSTSGDAAISFNNIQYLTVTGLTFRNAATAISGAETAPPDTGTPPSGITVTNNKFYYCTGTFIPIGTQNYSDIIVTDNYLYRVGNGIELLFNGNGVLSSTVTGAHIDRNTLVDAGTYDGVHRWSECWTNTGVTTGEYCGLGGQNLVSSTIQDNIVLGGFILGVNLYANENSIVRDNLITHNYFYKDTFGVFWMQAAAATAGFDNNVISYNITNQCGTESRADGQDYITNLIQPGGAGTHMNYYVNNTSYGGVVNLAISRNVIDTSVNWTFKNNIVNGNSGYNVSLSIPGTPANLVFDRNLYSTPTGNNFRYNSYTPCSFDQFKALYSLGFEANSPIPQNPKFINASGDYSQMLDLHLQPGSPAANAGTRVPRVHNVTGCADLDGVPCNSMAIHIGAYGPARPDGTPIYYPTITGIGD